ncbi:hypothetical protein COV16_05775 [Candidatus Woesearchaeota archaeon CG10_big_fil_rev_8_21_14_0_10_34_8]|nr:MAG: hypothetical protein COV16_05775 [Candidatus Woesearchaeota archaeon CG10_big_fil_rev_8_21_14_0_10_34_8]
MKYIIFVVLISLFVAGCGSNTVYVCADGSEVTDLGNCVETAEEITEQTTDETSDVIRDDIKISSIDETEEVVDVSVVDYTISDEEEALLESRFGAEKRAEISRPLIKNLKIGDVYVVGLGIRNILGASSHDFEVDVVFRQMKDYSNSVHDTDNGLLDAWMSKNLYTTYTLERSDELVLPLIIEVGDELTNTGDPVLPGNYIYDIYVYYLSDGGRRMEYESLMLTVQVAE